MNILLVDDEASALRDLHRVMKTAVAPEDEIFTARDSGTALALCKEKLIDVLDHSADIALNMGLDIAAVENIAVCEFSADQSRHRAEPDALVNFIHISGGMGLLPLFDCCQIHTERLGFAGAVCFMLRD